MIYPDAIREKALLMEGFSRVAGIDEVGKGSWAGPVVAACAIVPAELYDVPDMKKVRDSKTLSKKNRDLLSAFLREKVSYGIGEVSSQEIDRIGITQATRVAMERAIENCSDRPDYLLVDGQEAIATTLPQQTIIDGDALSVSIAAASIIAKVYRDTLMESYEKEYTGYSFSSHVGYGTKLHQDALASLGPCAIHRLSYKPVKRYSK